MAGIVIRLPQGVAEPSDFFIYGKTATEDIIGWTEDTTNFGGYQVSEIPTDTVEFYIPSHEESTYLTYVQIREKLDALQPLLVEEVRTAINEERDRLCFSPIAFGGYTFKADQVSQQDITDAALLAMYTGPSFRKTWLALEGAVDMDYNMMIGLKMELGKRREALVYEANQMKMQLPNLQYEQLAQFEIKFVSYPIVPGYE